MEKTINFSTKKVDETIHSLKMLCYEFEDRHRAENAVDDLAYYILTNRATVDYLKAFCDLSKSRQRTLIKRMLRIGGSTEANIAVSKKFLKVA